MEASKLYMNPGDGENSYAKNSAFQVYTYLYLLITDLSYMFRHMLHTGMQEHTQYITRMQYYKNLLIFLD